uniref:Uncharacterized protein n=1 Tax=Physcomitrium patens TaxID=3218 RepID=A0A2K1KN21_PHYPA|nr:hypothetical protein PHYPA_006074 [Physcomitrium patens]
MEESSREIPVSRVTLKQRAQNSAQSPAPCHVDGGLANDCDLCLVRDHNQLPVRLQHGLLHYARHHHAQNCK